MIALRYCAVVLTMIRLTGSMLLLQAIVDSLLPLFLFLCFHEFEEIVFHD